MTLQIDMVTVAVGAALALRLAVLLALLPFLGQKGFPVVWRVAVAGIFAAALTPAVRATMPAALGPLQWTDLVGEAARSLLVGALLAVAISIPFEIVKFAGQIVDVQIGFAIVNVIDPQTGTQMSVLANVYYLVAAMIFFALDAHYGLVRVLVGSCTLLPLFSPLAGERAAWLLVQEFVSFFRLGLLVGAPCILVLLLVSAAMGVIVKTVPQINILVVGFPVKIAVGLAILGLSMTWFGQVFRSLLNGMEGQVERLLGALQP